ncbi:MAG: hypothetical protein R3Y52_03110 [Psittacicella sp.]
MKDKDILKLIKSEDIFNDLLLLIVKNFNSKSNNNPYIVNISGSVSSGKTTFANHLRKILLERFSIESSIVSTDNFLYPTKTLISRGILNKKGFPISYDSEALIDFFINIMKSKEVLMPIYSHEKYDILPEKQAILVKNVIIVDGINSLSLAKYTKDFDKLNIYLDVDEKDLRVWYIKRFLSLVESSKNDEKLFYFKFRDFSIEDLTKLAINTWESINLINLNENILPSSKNADIILHKDKDHFFI